MSSNNSVLNPEAPEFHPKKQNASQDLQSLCKTVLSSNSFPKKGRYEYFKTFTDFNIVAHQLTENVVGKSNDILNTETPDVKLKKNNLAYNTEIIIDGNNRLLDRFEIHLELLRNKSATSQSFESLNIGNKVSSWNYGPTISTVQIGPTKLLCANIPRPQFTFKDAVDNSNKLWVPKIVEKPNSIKPLALNMIYNEKGEPIGFEHPYKVELDLYEPPAEILEPNSHSPRYPPPMTQNNYTLVDTEEQFDKLVRHLASVKEIAVDMEHHSYRSYQGITCLIQVTTDEGGDFLIDALALRDQLHKLNESFTDPRKLKVFHGADMDVLWLQRDFGVYIVGLFDTFRAACVLRKSGMGLKHLLKQYCDVEIDKKHQLADWRIRPLPDELVEYARLDTHYLLYVWRRMKTELILAANGDNLLRSVFEKSKITCAATYNKPIVDDTSHLSLYGRLKRFFNSRQIAALKVLYMWRDAQARLLDESVAYLLPNHILVFLAETLPREMQGVTACCQPMTPFLKQNLLQIHRMLLSCRELPLETLSQSYNTVSEESLLPPVASYDVHDMALMDEPHVFMSDDDFVVENSEESLNEFSASLEISDCAIQMPIHLEEADNIENVSNLIVDAQMYVPPYLRYRGYRLIAKIEEIKNMESKEAKVEALAKDDQLIKTEILFKLKQCKSIKEKEQITKDMNLAYACKDQQEDGRRKRKMSIDKVNKNEINEKLESQIKTGKSSKWFQYRNVNYQKYQSDCNASSKEGKTKFNKHKK